MAVLQYTRKTGSASRRRRRVPLLVSHILLSFIAFTMIAPAFAGSFSAQPSEMSGLFGDRIVICTGSGMKVIYLDEAGAPLPERDEEHAPAIGFCAPMATAALVEFRDKIFTRLRPARIPEFSRPAEAILMPHGTETPPALTRGPPVQV
ncbi:hypothetical protein [Parvibaculum sp.]|uniref:hypothetical protein n=1 Tax=Parvibaculum sp. TaxID=2024848 RepID=UPI00391A2DF3